MQAPLEAGPLSRRLLARLDGVLDRLYGWRYNPLYQSGALTVVLLAVITITGLYLLLFYRIGAPYESVARISDQAWAGRWIRGLHRYASDAAVVAVGLHAFRMYARRRSWGARALAWVSGLFLLFLLFVCGWTGYVMVWDVHAQALAVEGARLLEVLPIFAEPISRTFVGDQPMSGQFFFLNLFLHVALPIGLGLVLWIHVSRIARPTLAPPSRLWVATLAVLGILALAWPAPLPPPADLLRLPGRVPLDVFYSFWLPVSTALPAWAALAVPAAGLLLVALAPLWTRPRKTRRPPPSVVDERLCTGCVQCSLDCPYEAIAMHERTDGRAELVARVDPALCTSCGICAGSCAPMGVGPPGRTGRDQLARVREWTGGPGEATARLAGDIVVVACDRGPVRAAALEEAPVYVTSCVGNVHTSVVEHLLRVGAAGVLVLSCPPRDCWNREGPKWAGERLFHDREAELHERVDRRRVALAHAGAADGPRARVEIREFRARIEALERAVEAGGGDVDLVRECDPAEPERVVRT